MNDQALLELRLRGAGPFALQLHSNAKLCRDFGRLCIWIFVSCWWFIDVEAWRKERSCVLTSGLGFDDEYDDFERFFFCRWLL